VVIIAIRESRGYILPKRPDLGRFGLPLHIHAGLKSLASLVGLHGAGDGKKRAEGTTERIPIIHDAGWYAQRQSCSV